MKRAGLAIVLLALAWAPASLADIPQLVMDRLAELPAERATPDQLNQAADNALSQWRAASPETAARLAEAAARSAHRAGRSAEALEAARAVLGTAGVDPSLEANARLILALETFATDTSTEAQLVQALEGSSGAHPVLRARAARALAIAHMRRDEQEAAIARWRQSEAAAADISNERTYDYEVALIGRAASHAYRGESREGAEAVETVLERMRNDMARLSPAREMTSGEQVYVNAVVWRSALSIHRAEVSRDWSYVGVGTATRDEAGRPLCRGDFRFRPRPHFPIGAVFGRWSGASVLRLATDAEGRVIHAESVAAVPPTPLFSRVTLDVAPEWRFIPDEDETPGVTCRLQAEGWLVNWRFESR